MPKAYLAISVALIAAMTAPPIAAQSASERSWTRADNARHIEFPRTAAGNQVLAVDTHTHTLFSDGSVWPTFRLWEAEQDHLAAYAVTDHLEYHPYSPDIVTEDHNRPYTIVTKEAARIESRVQIINGAEITRNEPWGHFNALFLRDANALPLDATLKLDPRAALKAARSQGAFLIWNHPWVLPGLDDTLADPMPTEQQALVKDGLIDAIEIANSSQYSAPAFQVALKHGLAIVAASDVHHAIDADSQIPEGQHRTVTLVLAPNDTLPAIHDALLRKRTAALYRQTLYGRAPELSEIVGASLHMTDKKPVTSFLTKDVIDVELRNDAFIPFELRLTSASPLTSPRILTVPAHGKLALQFANVADPEKFSLDVEVLNAFVDPQHSLTLSLR